MYATYFQPMEVIQKNTTVNGIEDHQEVKKSKDRFIIPVMLLPEIIQNVTNAASVPNPDANLDWKGFRWFLSGPAEVIAVPTFPQPSLKREFEHWMKVLISYQYDGIQQCLFEEGVKQCFLKGWKNNPLLQGRINHH